MRKLITVTAMGSCFAAALTPAAAEPGLRLTLDLERHHTSNALDAAIALPDWYSALRGEMAHTAAIGDTALELTARGEVTSFDRLHLEDDRAVVAAIGAERVVAGAIQLRGSLGYKLASEGDDLIVEDVAIGIRTLTRTLHGGVQAGVDLGHGFAALLDLTLSREAPGRTHFEAEIVEPIQLSATKNRIGMGAKLGRTAGPWTIAAAANLETIHAGGDADAPLSFRLDRQRAQLEAKWAREAGLAVTAALGGERLRGVGGAVDELRPVYSLEIRQPLTDKATLRAALAASFDTANADDPVASWFERQEVEALVEVSKRVSIGFGAYRSWREYLSLGGGEHAHGGFAELAYSFERPLKLVLRADLSESRFTEGDRISKADIQIALKASM